MSFKLTSNISNISGGSRTLTHTELEALTNGDSSTTAFTLTTGQSLYLQCDLNNRYKLDRIKYYYTGTGVITVSISETSGTWVSVSTSSISGGIEAVVSSDYLPRWVKITHTISSGSAAVKEIEIYNEGSNILFGYTGTFTSYAIDAAGNNIQPFSIYNNTSTSKDICLFIETNRSTETDEVVKLGVDSGGPFYLKREKGISLPRDFDWNNGKYINTRKDPTFGYLTLSGTSTSGTYYSPVIDISLHENNRVFWDYNLPSGSLIDYRGPTDSERCVGMRRHNSPPTSPWTSGLLAGTSDSYWSTSVGSLVFNSIPNDTILEYRDNDFIQFAITITGSYLNPPYITNLGIESAVVVSGVGPYSYKDAYMTSVSGVSSGKTANILCWYTE